MSKAAAHLMPIAETQPPTAPPSVIGALLPIMGVVLVGFLVIGLALPVLPLHVSRDLGFGAFVVGLVTGSQFLASLVSRIWAGHFADRKGAKSGVVAGLFAAAASGLLYVVSLALTSPAASVSVLLLGRAVLGAAESFIITGAVSWGLVLVGPQGAGRVIAWVGTAMFAALALGAPVGTMLYAAGGFGTVAIATTLIPFATLLLLVRLPAVRPSPATSRGVFRSVAKAVWLPGIGAALSSIGFGAILAFASLLFANRGWTPVWLAFTAYAVALITARLGLGHLPDRIGGARVALGSALVETAGLALIWLAPGALVAAAGAALTGFGYGLVYPALGVEAVRRAPPQSRGLVMGMYTAFLDVALGFGTPALGLIAGLSGLGTVFLAAALAVLLTTAFAVLLLAAPAKGVSFDGNTAPHKDERDDDERDDHAETQTRKKQSRSVGDRVWLYGVGLRLCHQGQPARGRGAGPRRL
jgi:MFS family permease